MPAEPATDPKGAQIALDPDSDASKAARGTLHPTLEENTEAFKAEAEKLQAEADAAAAAAAPAPEAKPAAKP